MCDHIVDPYAPPPLVQSDYYAGQQPRPGMGQYPPPARVFADYPPPQPQPQPQPTAGQTMGNYGAFGAPPFYPPPAFDYYGHYPTPPPPPPGYNYPPGPVFFSHFFAFLLFVTYVLEATHVICSKDLDHYFIMHFKLNFYSFLLTFY